jgi:hypothetical protein
MLEDQHPDDHLGWCAGTAATSTLRPSLLKRLRHDLNHGVVLEQRVDLSQPVGPQFVTVGQQDFEQTPLALSALHHTRSFAESSRAGTVVRRINRRNGRIDHSVTIDHPASVPVSGLRRHFFTGK